MNETHRLDVVVAGNHGHGVFRFPVKYSVHHELWQET